MRYLMQRLVVVAFGAVVLILPACSRQQAGGKASQPNHVDQRDKASGPQTIADLGLDTIVEAALKQHADWDADDHTAEGDALKAAGSYPQAAAHYLAALRLEPQHLFARYQLACDFALWGHKHLALATLRDVVQRGFWGYEMMRDDSDLDRIMRDPEFANLLEQVRLRFSSEAAKHVSHPHLRVPEGTPPRNGWPALLFLHGYGDTGENYVGHAAAAAENGFIGIAVSGPIVHWDRRYAWPADHFATTHDYLQKILDRYQDRMDMDRSRIFLCGFSQGALHAVGLVATWPQQYAGAIALSPGGQPMLPKAVQPTVTERPLYVTVGEHEYLGNKLFAQHCADLWLRRRWPVRRETHPGGHEFPKDWAGRFPHILRWLGDPTKGD